MTGTLPTGRQGQMLALGITMIFLAIAWFAVAAPAIGLYQDRADKLHQREALVAHMEALAATLPALRQQASSREDDAPPAIITIEGGSDAVAAATLQNAVQEMATSAGASLSSIEIAPADTVGAYRRVGIKLSLNAPWPVLVALLKSIEESSPPMLVDDLEIHASPIPKPDAKQQLDTAFTVYGFRAVTPTKAPS